MTKEKTVAVAQMDMSGIKYEGDTYVAVADDEQSARLAIARRLDERMAECGEQNRERFFAEHGITDDGTREPLSATFGEDLDAFAEILNEWWGIYVHHVVYGEARLVT
jgi:hypothetical protein